MKILQKDFVANEYQECRTYWEWSQLNPLIKNHLVHHVNEGKRSIVTGHRLKIIGMSKGLPDYQLFIPNLKYHGLLIEMKSKCQKGKKQKKEQTEWIDRLIINGYFATFAFGADEAIKITTDYLQNKL